MQSWFYAIYLFTYSPLLATVFQLERQLGVTYKTAWRMGHKIREHMVAVDGEEQLSGDVEVDEAFFGGVMPRSKGNALDNKTIIMGMVERDGDVMTKVIPNTSGDVLKNEIIYNVEAGSTLHTDERTGYQGIDEYDYKHDHVNHHKGEYEGGDVHVNTIEGFWSLMKKGIAGTHVHASEKHMAKYAKEFEYRYNARKEPENMFPELMNTFPEKSD